MKAAVFERYGSWDVLRIADVPRPTPGEGEVLVRVHAVSINDWDWQALQGIPFANRQEFGLFGPKKRVLGSDISGMVESIGKGVKGFKTGDPVFGDLSTGYWGGFAEYAIAPVKVLAVKPDHLSFEEAAAIPQAGSLALGALRFRTKVKKGDKILINGAGGGAGSFGIQMAKDLGADVTGVDRGIKLEHMLSLGANSVMDHEKEDFTRGGILYDRIIDNVVRHPLSHYRRILKPGGVCGFVGGDTFPIMKAFIFGGKRIGVVMLRHEPKNLLHIADLIKDGRVKVPIDRTFGLDDISKAMEHFGKGHHLGKVVIKVASD
jgi:NADPH:quinone reductase-like Zn-dependent oxidoreductase